MKAVRIYEFGTPEVLRIEEVEKPAPGPGEILLKHEMIGVNFAETLFRRGLYGRGGEVEFPTILGLEAAGVVEEVGGGVESLKPGDHVSAFFRTPSGYAEYSVLRAELALPIPQDLPWEIAAAFPIQGLTAHFLVHFMHNTHPGQIVLIHAVAGGVGLLATQMAKNAGARVIGTCSTEEKAEIARGMGADDIILYTQKDFAEEARRLTDGRGVDLILDSVGAATFEKGVELLAPFGQIILFGSASGVVPRAKPQHLMVRSRTISGFWLNTLRDQPLLAQEGSKEVLSQWMQGKLKFTIEGVYPLEEVQEVHRRLEGRQTHGKLLMKP
ncbi:MAG: hypothetical protein B1H03_01230 [Planctomycetales bacterium 4484_113]|nr:MAG: hypothetical protein B1H03_01230 [Planctomycetales bacterium 4484_113]